MPERPRVGISRCLLGDEVRYDGGHKRDDLLLDLAAFVEWIPVCPEVELGMGVPREPIHLVSVTDGEQPRRIRLVGIDSGEDWTERMHAYAHARVRDLLATGIRGYVLKARSPSCGPAAVPTYSPTSSRGTPMATDGRGLFADTLMRLAPELPVEDEERLRRADVREEFLGRVGRFGRL